MTKHRAVAPIALLVLPSAIWSLIFRAPVLVSDPLLFVPVEMLLPSILKAVFRALWLLLSAYGLLIAWGIYPESYIFYLKILLQSAGSPQSIYVLFALILTGITIALPIRERNNWNNPILIIALSLFFTLNITKLTKSGQDVLSFVKTPALRGGSYMVLNPNLAVFAGENRNSRLYDPLLAELSTQKPPKKILVIVLEAWGENRRTLNNLGDLAKKMGFDTVTKGFVPYHGATLANEVRVLCGQSLNYEDPSQSLANCLPKRMADKGFDTLSIHGNDGVFYYRHLLYPQMGFARSMFAADLPSKNLCAGAFVGQCDDEVLAVAIKELAHPGSRLVYVLSLSAHIPVGADALLRPYVRAISQGFVGEPAQTVNRAAIWYVLSRAARLESDATLYFVGDHNPAGSEGSPAVVDGQVPFLIVHRKAF